MLGFVSGNRALAGSIEWSGPVDEPLQSFFEEEDVRVASRHVFMSRVLDVENALTARGWPPACDASITLQIEDPFFSDSRAWHVDVVGGKATVAAAPAADMRLDAGMFASMFTGWTLARDGARVGRLTGTTERDVDQLEAMFARPKPWVMDLV